MRRGYIDWLRGLAVLIMVEAHTLDAWTRPADRGAALFGYGGVLGGFGAPLFLFLAGVAVPLAVAAKVRRGATPRAAVRAVERRGLEVFGLAFLFRLQAKVISGGSWAALLKVDILNIIGPSIALAAAIVGWSARRRTQLIVLAACTALVGLVTPLVRAASWPAVLPDFIEGYLRPIPGLTNFTLLPWAGFALAGAFVGVLLEPLREHAQERRANVRFLVAGLALAVGGYLASYVPSPYEVSYFWTSSPAFFAMRVGILVLALPVSFAWAQRRTLRRWSFMQQFGRTSLFVYWIHIEMVYGWLSEPLHRSLSLPQWGAAYVAFTGLLLGISVAKSRVAEWWSHRRSPLPERAPL